MLSRILEIDVNLKSVNIQEGEHLKQDFIDVRFLYYVWRKIDW